jgi:serine/threonine protein kinase
VSGPPPIEGKYDILAKIREGGMGALYLVRHRLLNERRVIKVMRPELAQSAEQQKRFLREAQTATRLKHENIVGFYDFFMDQEGTASMVMEYIEGITLRDMIRSSGPLPIALGVRLSSQCLAGLDYLHRKGIVHRDISPDNIMVTADEDGTFHAKLIDLGIARIAQMDEGLTRTGEFLGKLRYSSPEQLLGRSSSNPIDGRSDIFSLGVVIYEMLTGSCPYATGSVPEILNARLSEPPMPFEEADPGKRVSEGLRAIVLRALQRKPEDRYQSAAEFGAALADLPAAERAPEDPKEISQYVSRALQAETKATEERILSNKSLQEEIPPTLIPVTAPLGADDQRRTVYLGPTVIAAAPGTIPEPARGEPKRKRSRVLILALAAGVALVLAATVLLTRGGDGGGNGKTTRSRTQAPETPVGGLNPGGPTASPTAAVVTVTASQPQPPTVAPSPSPTLTRTPRPTRAPTTTVRPTVVTATPQPTPTKTRFCFQPGGTYFDPGKIIGCPPGFQCTPIPKVQREDFALMKIRIEVSPAYPLEGEPAFVSVGFENKGTDPVHINQLLQSLNDGGFQNVTNAQVPVNVQPRGDFKDLYRYEIQDLRAGKTYTIQFSVVDIRKDTWIAGFSLRPCPH